jgi:hypothetical protein
MTEWHSERNSNGISDYCDFNQKQKNKPIESLYAVDHSARGSMKNAAKCETKRELQDFMNVVSSNANCGYGLTVATSG